ncbi:MAG: O-antigen ligase family protein [Flavobacteriales bacterium]|nr:O-antigen ligase family protein [Flavobacteriales bacterium]
MAGILYGPSSFVVIPFSALLLMRKNHFIEILLGFWFILILSDATINSFQFAQTFKPFFIVILALIFWLKRKAFFHFENTVFKLFLPFIIWSFVVIAISPEPFICFQKTLSYGLLLLIVPFIVSWAIKNDRREFYRGFILFGVFILTLGYLLYLVFPELTVLSDRYKAILGNPNGLGIFSMLLFILFEFSLSRDKTFFSKREKWFIYIIIISSLLLSQTRSAIFAAGIYFVFSRIYFISGFFGFILFASILVFYNEIAQQIIGFIQVLGLGEFFRLDTFSEGSGRWIAWQFAFSEIQNNIFVGKGFNYTEILYKENYPILSRLGHEGNAHQSFLTFWLDTGLVGLLSYSIALFLCFWRGAKNTKLAWPILYAIVFSVSFESWLTASLNPFTIILFILISCMIIDVGAKEIDYTTDIETS